MLWESISQVNVIPSVATDTVLLVLNPCAVLVITNSPFTGLYAALDGVNAVVHPVTVTAFGDEPTN